jgi:hypothetical protein
MTTTATLQPGTTLTDETDRHGTALADEPRPVESSLLDLAPRTLADLVADGARPAPGSTLDSVMRRLFDPRDRDRLTVSAFASGL